MKCGSTRETINPISYQVSFKKYSSVEKKNMKCGSDYIRYFQLYNLNQIMRTEFYTGSDMCLKLLLLTQAVRVVVHPLAASHW